MVMNSLTKIIPSWSLNSRLLVTLLKTKTATPVSNCGNFGALPRGNNSRLTRTF